MCSCSIFSLVNYNFSFFSFRYKEQERRLFFQRFTQLIIQNSCAFVKESAEAKTESIFLGHSDAKTKHRLSRVH